MPLGPPPGASLASYLVPLAVVALVIVLRNSRPRRLKIERLWTLPAIYVVLAIAALYEAPPPVTPVSIAILVVAGENFELGRLISPLLRCTRSRSRRTFFGVSPKYIMPKLAFIPSARPNSDSAVSNFPSSIACRARRQSSTVF